MENLFFDIIYSTVQQLIIKILVFISLTGILIWFIDLVLTKLLFKRSKQRKELSMRLSFLWSIFVYFILFNIYIFVLLHYIGLDAFDFLAGMFYLGIMPQLIVYLGLIIMFLSKQFTLRNIINEKQIN